MDGKVDRVLVNLRVLSQVTRNGRLRKMSQNILELEHDSYLLPIRRYLTGDSRKQNISDVSSVLSEAFDIVRLLLNSKFLVGVDEAESLSEAEIFERKQLCERLEALYRELDGAAQGLQNLSATYPDDVATLAQLQRLNEKITSNLRLIRSKVPSLVSEDSLI